MNSQTLSILKKIAAITLLFLLPISFKVKGQEVERMAIGTNFWFLAPDWSGENPWKWQEATDRNNDHNQYVPENPYTNGIDPWNGAFLEETSIYSCFRFMDWQKTNGSEITSWSQRRLPDDKANFGANTIGTSSGNPGAPGLAYEWMIDLCNRQQADIWLCVPHGADDDFIKNLAALVKEKLDSELNIYIEYSNEVWNFRAAQDHCKEMAKTIGENNDFSGAMKYQAYRSAQIWKFFEDEFGEEKNRVINVISGQSTNSWQAENQHLSSLFNEDFNPTGVFPEAYGIAPYFGGNGLDGADPQVWSKMRTDIFEHRHNKPDTDSRLQDVKEQFAVAQKFGVDLIAYEGGQHLGTNALAPNKDPRMYPLYIDYLNAINPYLELFCHYTHAGNFSNGGCWGAKQFTGQPEAQAHKYRALKDWENNNPQEVTSISEEDMSAADSIPLYPNPITGTEFHIELQKKASVILQDNKGKIINKIEADVGNVKIPAGQLANGFYLLTVNNGAMTKSVKIVVAK